MYVAPYSTNYNLILVVSEATVLRFRQDHAHPLQWSALHANAGSRIESPYGVCCCLLLASLRDFWVSIDVVDICLELMYIEYLDAQMLESP